MFLKYKILKKYASAKEDSAGVADPDTNSNSIQADAKSLLSLNDSFNTVGSGSTGLAGSQQQLERDLATYKERYQSAEEIRLTLSRDLAQLQGMYDMSKENIKKLVQDKMDQEERIQLLVLFFLFLLLLNYYFFSGTVNSLSKNYLFLKMDELNRIKAENENLSNENTSSKMNLNMIQVSQLPCSFY